MSAGTINLTNGSAVVGGAGTSFATELAAGDFIVSTVGGVPYTLPVKSVESNVQLTLVSSFTGPTQSDTAWSAVPRVALNMVTAALVAQSAEALRGLNYDKQNWQSIFSGNGNVTVTLPDGTKWTGPAWNSITTILSGKAAKGANDDITSLSGLTTALSLEQGGTGSTTESGARKNLGLGNSATRDVGSAAGTVAAGNDNRLNTLEGKTGGGITGAVIAKRTSDSNPASGGELESVLQNSGGSALSQFHMFTQMAGNTRYGFLRVWDTSTFKDWYFDHSSGNAYAAAAWVNNSDRRIKDKLTPIEDVFEKMKKIRGYTWVRKDDQMKGSFGIGFVAQEVQEVFPEAVSHSREGSLTVDGQVIEKPLALSPGDVAAALHHEAILMLMSKIEELTGKVEAMQAGS
ncbi:tail fiber domain-containing protein [Enterobacter roggenkampii]|uniref:tail fiber domain-containing protein n=1 Tax=Enterobacter roggenkampii TaxID=1812935 RepID=UPI00294A3D39|nr:tail fiber domain-containing protein [Enterobacter roggenkampii]MDV5319021.1 tail fiber domain-containing protein [Enterobacter roggenkampii]MDV5328968.1 tail fiber domain-containing protein [Enterobacter roggenkampii]HCK7280684.1 tail fiber domain-containing protein [Enterobacter roggenkampii]